MFFDPAAAAWLIALTLLYVRAVRVLRGRGYRVPMLQQVAWHSGVALWAVALLSPIGGYSDRLFSAHMAEHLLLTELGAPLLLVGARTPVLQFLLPRPVLKALARRRRLRKAFSVLRRPLVAVPLYILVLYAWHFRALFVGALENPVLHVLQHQSFIATSLLVWWAALEPQRRRMPGGLWKIGHLLAARLGGMFLGMAFLIMRTPAYASYYGDSAREYGLTPLEDQQLGGGMMLTLDTILMLFALALFFWRSAADHDREEEAATLRSGATTAPP